MTTYHRPATLKDALLLLPGNPVIVAGATDMYPGQTQQQAWGQGLVDCWLDISAIPDLHAIHIRSDHWRIGSMVTWSELLHEPLPSYFDGLKAAAREVGGMQIQNRATLAGNLCNASPAADGVPPLLCLDASVELTSADQQRVVPLEDFLVGNRKTLLAPDELLTAIIIPRLVDDTGSFFYKLGARKYLVISIVMAAAVVSVNEQSEISDLRLAVGSCSAVAQRLTALEADLIGCSVNSPLAPLVTAGHFASLSPIDDIRADAHYRRHAALEVIQRLVSTFAQGTESQ